MGRTTDIVVTTVHEPAWLPGYLDNLRAHGRDEDTTLRIVCDRKTPKAVYDAAAEASRNGYRVDCPTLDEQTEYLRRIAAPEGFVPWDTDNRRNIGFLRAWEHGTDVLISIDDDNYCLPDADFVGEHLAVGERADACERVAFASGAPWFNVCDRLEPKGPVALHPRGFPYAAREEPGAELSPLAPEDGGRTVAVNCGLWIEDPDVDALTRLTLRPRVTGADTRPVVLAPETWTPINTQNTALRRDTIPAYWYVRMGFALQGLTIDRFGDILSGYFVQKCAKHLGDCIRVGAPVAEHRRTPHDLFVDLAHELAGVVLLEDLLPWLQEVALEGATYTDAAASLADALEAQAPRFTGFVWDDGGREFLVETARSLRTWLDLIGRLA